MESVYRTTDSKLTVFSVRLDLDHQCSLLFFNLGSILDRREWKKKCLSETFFSNKMLKHHWADCILDGSAQVV